MRAICAICELCVLCCANAHLWYMCVSILCVVCCKHRLIWVCVHMYKHSCVKRKKNDRWMSVHMRSCSCVRVCLLLVCVDESLSHHNHTLKIKKLIQSPKNHQKHYLIYPVRMNANFLKILYFLKKGGWAY